VSTLTAVTVIIWAGLALYWLAGVPGWLRIRRETRVARARQEQQDAAQVADLTPDEAAELAPAGGRSTSWAA